MQTITAAYAKQTKKIEHPSAAKAVSASNGAPANVAASKEQVVPNQLEHTDIQPSVKFNVTIISG